jgi:hypothetical protein
VLTGMFSLLSGLKVICEGHFRHITTVAGCRLSWLLSLPAQEGTRVWLISPRPLPWVAEVLSAEVLTLDWRIYSPLCVACVGAALTARAMSASTTTPHGLRYHDDTCPNATKLGYRSRARRCHTCGSLEKSWKDVVRRQSRTIRLDPACVGNRPT